MEGNGPLLRKIRRLVVAAVWFGLLASAERAEAGSIVGSKHDLSSVINKFLGSGMENEMNNYGEVCVYCHTPHGASDIAPLWNRNTPTGPYQMYASPTMEATVPGTPTGISLACLSCHDGTIAVDSVRNQPGSGTVASSWYGKPPAAYHYAMSAPGQANASPGGSCAACHGTPNPYPHNAVVKYLTTDLRDDHPISIVYSEGDGSNHAAGFNPPVGDKFPNGVRLYSGRVECASCHNVHDPAVPPFLRTSNANSSLCKTCHIK